MRYNEFNNILIDGHIGVSPVGDDTELIARAASEARCKSILDVGTGTGFVPIYLASLGRKCVGVDINEYAILCAKENALRNNVKCQFYLSDLFSRVSGKFDLISFNPPFGNTVNSGLTKFLEIIKSLVPKNNDFLIAMSYLMIRKQRRRLVERFLQGVKKHLKKNGRILLLLYPPEIQLIKNYSYKIVGRYKDFSLVDLRF